MKTTLLALITLFGLVTCANAANDKLIVDPSHQKIILKCHGASVGPEYIAYRPYAISISVSVDEQDLGSFGYEYPYNSKDVKDPRSLCLDFNRTITSAKAENKLINIDFAEKSVSIKENAKALNECIAERETLKEVISSYMTNQNQSNRSNNPYEVLSARLDHL